MTKKNVLYLDRVRRRYKYTDNLGKSDLEIVRKYTRHYAYSMPIIMGLFVTNMFRSINLLFKNGSDGTFDLVVLVLLTIAMGIVFIIMVFKYRRAESCRSELEDRLVNEQKQTEQGAAGNPLPAE